MARKKRNVIKLVLPRDHYAERERPAKPAAIIILPVTRIERPAKRKGRV